MKGVLDVYQCPYDSLRPVVCLDETNRQLIEKRRIPSKPGSPEREDTLLSSKFYLGGLLVKETSIKMFCLRGSLFSICKLTEYIKMRTKGEY